MPGTAYCDRTAATRSTSSSELQMMRSHPEQAMDDKAFPNSSL